MDERQHRDGSRSYGSHHVNYSGYGSQHVDYSGYGRQHVDYCGYGNQHVNYSGYGSQHVDYSGYGSHHANYTGYGSHDAKCSGYGSHHVDYSGYGSQHVDYSGYGSQHVDSRSRGSSKRPRSRSPSDRNGYRSGSSKRVDIDNNIRWTDRGNRYSPSSRQAPYTQLEVNWAWLLVELVPELARRMDCVGKPNLTVYGYVQGIRNIWQHPEALTGVAVQKMLQLTGCTDSRDEVCAQDIHR
jgi:hypothetical protein